MPRMLLTELALRAMKTEKQTDYWDTNLPGFGIRIGPKSKTFVLKHDNRRYTIGKWPQLSLKEARDLARSRSMLAQNPSSMSMVEAFESYKTTYLHDYRERSRKEVIRLIEKHCVPVLSSKLSDIHHRDISRIFAAIAPSEANHLYGVLRTFFTWCEKRDLCTNPVKKLDRPHKSTARSRILTPDELRLIWRACEQSSGCATAQGELLSTREIVHKRARPASAVGENPIPTSLPTTFCRIVQLLILSGQRRSEIANIQRSWISDLSEKPTGISSINGETNTCLNSTSVHLPLKTAALNNSWLTIPKEYTKNGTEHHLPLPPKYVHGENTWSGKGRMAGWMQKLVDEGHEKDEFLNPLWKKTKDLVD